MKNLVGVLLMLCGVVFGLYVGIWWSFIGGIVDIINESKAVDVDALNVAIGVAKIVFAGFAGWVSAMVFMVPGLALATKD
jgi:hypothetical protein